MKKIILLLVALLSLSMDSLAQEFTEIQVALRHYAIFEGRRVYAGIEY